MPLASLDMTRKGYAVAAVRPVIVVVCAVTLLVFSDVRLPYEVVTLYFTWESAGTAVIHVIVAPVAVVLELTALIQVCAEAHGAKIEIAMSARGSKRPL